MSSVRKLLNFKIALIWTVVQFFVFFDFGPEGWQTVRWSMYGRVWFYDLTVEKAGVKLSADEIFERYRIPDKSVARGKKHLESHLIGYEERYGNGDVSFHVKYDVNGSEVEWNWPID